MSVQIHALYITYIIVHFVYNVSSPIDLTLTWRLASVDAAHLHDALVNRCGLYVDVPVLIQIEGGGRTRASRVPVQCGLRNSRRPGSSRAASHCSECEQSARFCIHFCFGFEAANIMIVWFCIYMSVCSWALFFFCWLLLVDNDCESESVEPLGYYKNARRQHDDLDQCLRGRGHTSGSSRAAAATQCCPTYRSKCHSRENGNCNDAGTASDRLVRGVI